MHINQRRLSRKSKSRQDNNPLGINPDDIQRFSSMYSATVPNLLRPDNEKGAGDNFNDESEESQEF